MKSLALLCMTISFLAAFISGLCAGYTFALGYNLYAFFFVTVGFCHAWNVEKAYKLYKK